MSITPFGIALLIAPFLFGAGAIIAHRRHKRGLSTFLWVLTGIAVFGFAVVFITVGGSASSTSFWR